MSTQSLAPSHVLSVLSSRPEPKPLKMPPPPEKLSGSALHLMHAAGGYEHLNYTKRNWVDIVEDITAHAARMALVLKGSKIGGGTGTGVGGVGAVGAVQESVASNGTGVDRVAWPLLWE